jgi:hypothetical protein
MGDPLQSAEISEASPSTAQKTLQLNVDTGWYGTIAEIGAGQEVARWFFAVGGAAGTIAKTISAYDMTVSDGMYGRSPRYVSRERLEQMLEHEYASLYDALAATRGAKTTFFVFADTAATRSYTRRVDGESWLGIRFQHHPGSDTSQVLLHARLLDTEATGQRGALGLLGVNLIHAAWRARGGLEGFVRNLGEELSRERLEVDFVDASGPVFAGVDARRLNLELVLNRVGRAVAFGADGRSVEPGRALYKRAAAVLRDDFRPVRRLHRDMLEAAVKLLESENAGPAPMDLAEISIANLRAPTEADTADVLERLDALAAAGLATLVTDFEEFFRVAAYLRRYAAPRIVFVVGSRAFARFFGGEPFEALEGGVLEALGRLLTRSVRIAVYSEPDPLTGEPLRARTLPLPSQYRHLREHLFDNQLVVELG